jgi:hypothetical protein
MISNRKVWFLLFAVALSCITAACGSSTNPNGPDVVATVTNYWGERIPDATVVLGDSNGTMKAYGTTDENGEITFGNAPANATVTAANTCLRSGSTTTTYSIDVEYDVNGSAVLSLDNCVVPPVISVPSGSPAPLGSLTINVTHIPDNVTRGQITVGRNISISLGGLVTHETFTITENDLDYDQTFSVIVEGRDDDGHTVAYGVLLDLTFTDGMIVNVEMAPVKYVHYQLSNIPATAISLRPSLTISRQGKQGSFSSRETFSLSSAPSSTTLDVPVIPMFGDEFTYYIRAQLDQNHDGVADSYQRLSLSSGKGTNQTFDFSKALAAPVLEVTGAGTATPNFSWSPVDPAATSIQISAMFSSPTITLYAVNMSNLTPSRTSIRFPELPDCLAAFRPNHVESFSVSASAREGELYKFSSGYYGQNSFFVAPALISAGGSKQ